MVTMPGGSALSRSSSSPARVEPHTRTGGADVVFEIAGDLHAGGAESAEAFRVEFALREDEREPAEQGLPEGAEPPVAWPRAVGDAGVDDGDGDARPATFDEHARPEFCFDEDEQAGLKKAQPGADGEGEIEREIE